VTVSGNDFVSDDMISNYSGRKSLTGTVLGGAGQRNDSQRRIGLHDLMFSRAPSFS
jgi:hypothetical protein